MHRIIHICTALRLASSLLLRWLLACYRLDRQLNARDRQRYFPQMQAGVVFQGCRAIIRQASQPSLIDEIDDQRSACRLLWQAIHALPERSSRIQCPAAQRMLNCAWQRSIELILGPGCWTPDPSPTLANRSLREALLHWLENAGADRSQATYHSLRSTAGLLNAAAGIIDANMTPTQLATFETMRCRLRNELVHVCHDKIQQGIEQEYAAHHVALLAAPMALAQALAKRPRIKKPR